MEFLLAPDEITFYSAPVTETHTSITLPRERLDPDAVHVVERLQRAGYTTYFVGGCVRDLLLNRNPKDFDIATEAKPEELKELFGRRCRIIGRRFKLAHVHAGPLVLEVATFRGLPDDQEVADDASGFVVRANTFGTPKQDAMSRDFTVNGLFYDPFAREIIDWVDGQADVERRLLRTIGDAEARMREDPVRLLRAIKFAARLGFSLHADIIECGPRVAPLIATCPAARVSEELFRLTESGHAVESFRLMHELGVLRALLPEIADALNDEATRAQTLAVFESIDRLTTAHGTLDRPALFVLIAWPFIERAIYGRAKPPELQDWNRMAREMVQELSIRLNIPVRYRQLLGHAADILRRMRHPKRRRRPGRGQLISRSLPVALTLQRLHFLATGEGQQAYELWAGEAEEWGVWGAPFEPSAPAEQPRSSPPRRRSSEDRRRQRSDKDVEDGDGTSGDRKKRRRRRRRKKSPADDGSVKNSLRAPNG